MAKKRKTRAQKEKSQARMASAPPRLEKPTGLSDGERCMQEILQTDIENFMWTVEDHALRRNLHYAVNHYRASGAEVLADQFRQLQANLVRRCEALYTPILLRNEALRAAALETVVPYYEGWFTVNLSRQISFLPLELRLFLYIEMLKREKSQYHAVHILDRIGLTLCKMEHRDELDLCVFMQSWAAYNLFMTCPFQPYFLFFGYALFKEHRRLETLIQHNEEVLQRVRPLREKTMETAMLDGAELLDKEFWYGVNSFSNRGTIEDQKAAEMCLRLFMMYFEKIFLFVEEFETLTKEFYRTGNKTELSVFLERHQLDGVDMKSYRAYFNGFTGESMGVFEV